ncbi:uncharacterized protein LOC114527436 [Dendronephthya gigantea]|uniref:uncharacterized protein LOC114527436 n=1 Tax=Dendronephthya gigantea TaxID=151771 RepID=UPI00106CCD75|nr:uncharacterized protein LOC114527436 [Dendronephthya gigantea]
MPWTPAQRTRLVTEKRILEQFFPGRVQWIDPQGDTKVEVSLNTNNGNKYRLRIYLKAADSSSSDFPNSVPDMVVCSSPKPMPKWGADGKKHTLGYRDNFVKICHYRTSRWTDRSTLYEVVMKGRVWLEAYEGHLMTGKCLSEFLGEMRN